MILNKTVSAYGETALLTSLGSSKKYCLTYLSFTCPETNTSEVLIDLIDKAITDVFLKVSIPIGESVICNLVNNHKLMTLDSSLVINLHSAQTIYCTVMYEEVISS